MDKHGKQSIGCNVKSCGYNADKECTLDEIMVKPTENTHSGKACDESMCGSYKCRK